MGALQTDRGFTIVELMIVVLVLSILIAMAIPVYVSATSQASLRTCFQNQRTLEGAVSAWMTLGDGRELADLAGTVDEGHPIVADHIVGAVPRCTSGAKPSDPDNPTVSEGGYVFDANGTLNDCPHGRLGPHGHF